MELKNFFAQDDAGNSLGEATCYVYARGTESLILDLKKANGVTLANPFTTDQNGFAEFGAPNGLYDVCVTKGARNFRIRMQFNDVAETVGTVEAAAVRAEVALDAIVLSAGAKDDIEHGLATTSLNQTFTVLGKAPDDFVILYKNIGGGALELNRYPSAKNVPKVGLEGVYNLIDPAASTVVDLGLNGSNDYIGVPTARSLAIRVDPGRPIVIANPAGNFTPSAGYGAAFFSDLPTVSNKLANFNATTLTNLAGLTYRADVVPIGAKYLVLNTEFKGVKHNWFAAYDTGFTSVLAYEPSLAKLNDLKIFDREAHRKLAVAFSAVEGSDNLYSPTELLAGYLASTGGLRRDNAAWRYVRIPVVEGRTYAIYTGSTAWAFPVAGSYGVAGAEPAASGAKAALNVTHDEYVRTLTVPQGQGITHLFLNVFIKPPGGDIDFTRSLIVREGASVPVRQLPYEPTLAKVNGLPVKDAQARTALADINAAIGQRTGRYNLLNPAAPVVAEFGLNGSANYGALATGKVLAIPVMEGMPLVISNPAGNYLAFSGYGAAFFSELPTVGSTTKVRNFSDPMNTAPTVTTNSGLTFRRDVVPMGAKYLVLNTEFKGLAHNWFVGYDTGFTGAQAYTPTVSELNGVPITDRGTQIQVNEVSRLVSRRFAGKKVFHFGDSITEGVSGVSGYIKYITDILQCLSTNYGSSGARSSRLVGTMTNLPARDGTTHHDFDPDYTDVAAVTIMIGSNDAGTTGNGINGSLADIPTQRIQDLPFTTLGGVTVTTPDEYWALFPDTYYGNLSLCIEYVKWKNPKTVIYLVSAPQRGTTSTPMDAVVAAKTAIAKFYSIQYFNATHECGIDLKGLSTYLYDMLHPNDLGAERLGKYIGYRMLHS